jgi:amino acid transporter
MTDVSESPLTARPSLSAPFARKATGLVRELPLWDVIAYNAACATPIGAALALSLFFAFAAFPGANLVLALFIGLIGVGITLLMFSLLSAAMPRIGGDYAFVSRILHPALGLASNVCYLCAALLGTAWIASIGVRAALAPALATIGTLSGNQWWVHASETISKNGWTFLIGSLIVIGSGVVAALGTKTAGRIMSILYYTSLAGALVTLLVLVFTSHDSFVRHLNSFALPFTHTNDTYGATIAAGQKAGIVYPSASGYSVKNTIGAVFITYGITVSAYASVYLAGEMKGAGRRKRQLSAMFIGGYGQALLLILSVVVLLHTLGYNFFAAASNGGLGVPVAPYSNFFVGVVVGSTPVAGLLALAFVFAIPPWIYANTAIVYRGPFAWAFDGLIPRRFMAVNPRTHTPILAIATVTVLAVGLCAWSAFSLDFLTVFTYIVLFGYFTITMVAIAAILMPTRLPDVYRGSPADWKVAGMPVLPVVGVLALLWNLTMIGLAIGFHANIGIPHVATAIAVLGGTALAGVAFYYAARAVQRSRGVDIGLAYRAIPPE